MKANLSEIMCTIQGEGALVGTRQIFIRFSGCNLRCSYCDTPASLTIPKDCLVYDEIGKSDKQKLWANPLSPDDIKSIVAPFKCSWLSFTGGEPLLNPDFIKEIIYKLSGQGYKFLLETNGTLPEELRKVISLIDHISMDFKLPATTSMECWDEHEKFLFMAQEKPTYIKIVLTPDYIKSDLTKALQIIKSINPNIPLFIQPVTPRSNEKTLDIFTCISIQDYCMEFIKDVRILPQIHPWLGLT